MNEDREQPEDVAAVEEPQGPVGGERLAAARREKQLGIVEIAKELHLDEAKVRALERNDFGALGAPVFAKGHLRKYAELVGVDGGDVMADYYRLTRADGMPPIVSGRPKVRRELAPGPWIALIIIAVALAGAYWWLGVREPTARVPQRDEPVPAIEEPAGVLPEATTTGGSAAPPDDAPAPAGAAGDQAVVSDALPAAAASGSGSRTGEPVAGAGTTADGQLRLSLRFSGDCWTEITDASGRRLFFAMGRDGQSVDLTGVAPVSVLFGNAGNVRLEVDGAARELPATARPNQPVRLTLVRSR